MAEEKTKVEQVIEDINNLSEAEKRELTIAIRTTPEGNKAYVAFLYGVGRVNTPTPPTPVPPHPSPNLPTEKVVEEEQETEQEAEETESAANNSNANEEWL